MPARPAVGLDGPPARVAQPWLDVTSQIAEGPLWDDRSGELAWVDLEVGHVHWASPTGGPAISIALGQAVGAVLPRQSGGWVLPLEQGVATLDSPTSKPRRHGDGRAAHRRSRAVQRRQVRSVRSAVGRDHGLGRVPGQGALYRVDSDWSVTTMLTGLTLSNGMAWNRSADTMYFIDSRAAAVWAFDFDATTGGLGQRREHIAIAPEVGEPDGMTMDADELPVGCHLRWGRGRRYLPTGELDGIVEVPTPLVTSCTFATTTSASSTSRLRVVTPTARLAAAARCSGSGQALQELAPIVLRASHIRRSRRLTISNKLRERMSKANVSSMWKILCAVTGGPRAGRGRRLWQQQRRLGYGHSEHGRVGRVQQRRRGGEGQGKSRRADKTRGRRLPVRPSTSIPGTKKRGDHGRAGRRLHGDGELAQGRLGCHGLDVEPADGRQIQPIGPGGLHPAGDSTEIRCDRPARGGRRDDRVVARRREEGNVPVACLMCENTGYEDEIIDVSTGWRPRRRRDRVGRDRRVERQGQGAARGRQGVLHRENARGRLPRDAGAELPRLQDRRHDADLAGKPGEARARPSGSVPCSGTRRGPSIGPCSRTTTTRCPPARRRSSRAATWPSRDMTASRRWCG